MRLLKYGFIALISMMWPPSSILRAAEESSPSAASLAAVEAPELRSRYVEGVGGVPLNVIEAGQRGKPALVFIHGLGQSHLSWQFQLQSELADDYHLVAYDLRGHGNSGKPWLASDYAAPDVWAGDLERVLSATGARNPLLVTWSYGTWVAVDYLKTHRPDTISGLVMIGGLGGLIVPPPISAQPPSKEGARLARMRESGWLADNLEGGEGVNAFFLRRPVDPGWASRTAAVNALLPPYARTLILGRSFDNSGSIERVAVPTWLVVGDQDITLSTQDAASLAKRLPDATLTIREGAGHLPFAEDHEAFNQDLTAFARQVFSKR